LIHGIVIQSLPNSEWLVYWTEHKVKSIHAKNLIRGYGNSSLTTEDLKFLNDSSMLVGCHGTIDDLRTYTSELSQTANNFNTTNTNRNNRSTISHSPSCGTRTCHRRHW
jgi:hypothetical protein